MTNTTTGAKRRIADAHSINRVKRAMRSAEKHRGTVRAARLYIACRRWLGSWGPFRRVVR